MELAQHELREADSVISFAEGNRRLKISRTTALKWMKRADSTLPRPFRKGGRWAYRICDVEGHFDRLGARAQARPVGADTDNVHSLAHT